MRLVEGEGGGRAVPREEAAELSLWGAVTRLCWRIGCGFCAERSAELLLLTAAFNLFEWGSFLFVFFPEFPLPLDRSARVYSVPCLWQRVNLSYLLAERTSASCFFVSVPTGFVFVRVGEKEGNEMVGGLCWENLLRTIFYRFQPTVLSPRNLRTARVFVIIFFV